MPQKIIIAVDDSENAMRAVRQVAETFGKDTRITIFSVLPDTAMLCDMNSPELTPLFRSQQSSFCQLEDKKRALVTEACRNAKQILVGAGFPESQVEIHTEVKKKGVARDIVHLAESGYDLIVIGKRGHTGIKEFFMGSVPQKVLQLAKDTSVLVVN
ncbi:MAG: universal stress protein [Desulfobacterales bacterium]